MMSLRAITAAVLMTCLSATAMADASKEAENLLKLVRVDQMTVPVYAQAQEMLAQRYADSKAPNSKKAVLERYQVKANAELDRVIGWNALRPQLVKLYVDNFSETELKQLNDFYRSPLGSKVLEKMPMLTAQSVQLMQNQLQQAIEPVNKLAEDMSKELGAGQKNK